MKHSYTSWHDHPPSQFYGTSSADDCSRGGIGAPDANVAPSFARNTSANRENIGGLSIGSQRCCSTVSSNPLPPTDLLRRNTTRAKREENLRHGETPPPSVWHTAGETTIEGIEGGDAGDRQRLRSERGRDQTPHPGTDRDAARDPRALPAATRIAGTLRAQALAELLNDLREYRAASHPALRAFWRVLALHDIVRFKREFLRPERRAFEAAVARSQARRAAA